MERNRDTNMIRHAHNHTLINRLCISCLAFAKICIPYKLLMKKALLWIINFRDIYGRFFYESCESSVLMSTTNFSSTSFISEVFS